MMAYLWAEQSEIQAYLDSEGTIQIRDNDETESASVVKNFAQSAAILFENESVYEVATRLALVFEPDKSTAETGSTDLDVSVYGPTPLGLKRSVGATGVSGTKCPHALRLIVAKLCASKIAAVRLGASLAQLPNWVRVYKNEVNAQLQRWMLNAENAGIRGLKVRSDIDVADVLIRSKTRELGAIELEN